MKNKQKKYEPLLERDLTTAEESTLSDSSYSTDLTRLEPKQGITKFMLHLRLLLYKNVLLFWRSKKITLFQLLTPILSILVMFLLQHLFQDLEAIVFPNPPVNALSPLPLCTGDE